MRAPLTFNGRLPGVVCEAALPPSSEDPLRIDVAAFVGFAERGPLDLPVAVNDIGQYQEVFGNDLLLARTRQGGQPVYAALPQAVRSFFDNGGRRCYVVRVAGDSARANRFRLPGLVAWDNQERTFPALATVLAPAAWVGRWSDNMSIGTQLQSWPLHLASDPLPQTTPSLTIALELPTKTTVLSGDLLRLHFDGVGQPLLFCSVNTVRQSAKAVGQRIPVSVDVDPLNILAFTGNLGEPLPTPVFVERQEANVWVPLDVSQLILEELSLPEDGYRLDMTTPESVHKNDLLRIHCADGEILLFPVTAALAGTTSSPPFSSPPGEVDYQLKSRAPRWQLTPHSVELLGETGWEMLLSAPIPPLEVQMGSNQKGILSLPASESIQVGDLLRVTCMDNQVRLVLLFPITDMSLMQVPGTASPPDASPPEESLWQVVSQEVLWQAPFPPSLDAYGALLQADLLGFDLYIREGQEMQEIWPGLRFGNWLDKLMPTANDLQANAVRLPTMQRPVPGLDPTRSSRLGVPLPWLDSTGNVIRPLYLPLGMGALPGPDEFVKALPDPMDHPADPRCPLPVKDGLESFDHPTQLFLDDRLAGVGTYDLLNEANAILYQNKSADGQIMYLRKLHSLLMVDEVGLISLPDLIQRPWTCLGPASDGHPPSPPPPQPVDDGQFHPCVLPEPGPGPGGPTPCNGTFVFSSPPEEIDLPDVRQQLNLLPVLDSPETYQMDELLEVQRALVSLCAARADALAVLSLPLHFKKREVLEWQRRLTTPDPDEPGLVLETLDSTTLSYAAVYHSWLQIREQVTPQISPLRAMPPDGTICGMIAARELNRGPWIAPANVPLRGVVSLTPTFNTAEWAELFNAQVNLIRQLPGQFTLMSAHTLSLDDTFVQIAARRLLIFLRKLALRRGMRYVFEANNERFRQRVQTSFERTLALMAERGALTAFEVDTGSDINTQNDYDNGRFLIALKIAPTQPIEFITLVLLRAGEGLLEVIEG